MSAAERLLRRHNPRPTVRAWDLPTRLFKWSLVGLVGLSWLSSTFQDPAMTVHKASGYAILVLLVFRLLWGFVGSSTARFSSFLHGPRRVIAHVRDLGAGRGRAYLGHNPAGGWMVLGLLVICTVQVGLGLCASDGVLAAGPLAGLVGDDLATLAATLHSIGFDILLGFVALHVVANLFYDAVKREGLIAAMVTGRKPRADYADGASLVRRPMLLALLCGLAAVVLVFGSLVLVGAGPFATS